MDPILTSSPEEQCTQSLAEVVLIHLRLMWLTPSAVMS